MGGRGGGSNRTMSKIVSNDKLTIAQNLHAADDKRLSPLEQRKCIFVRLSNAALLPQRPYGLLRTGGPARPPLLSHRSRALSALSVIHR